MHIIKPNILPKSLGTKFKLNEKILIKLNNNLNKIVK